MTYCQTNLEMGLPALHYPLMHFLYAGLPVAYRTKNNFLSCKFAFLKCIFGNHVKTMWSSGIIIEFCLFSLAGQEYQLLYLHVRDDCSILSGIKY